MTVGVTGTAAQLSATVSARHAGDAERDTRPRSLDGDISLRWQRRPRGRPARRRLYAMAAWVVPASRYATRACPRHVCSRRHRWTAAATARRQRSPSRSANATPHPALTVSAPAPARTARHQSTITVQRPRHLARRSPSGPVQVKRGSDGRSASDRATVTLGVDGTGTGHPAKPSLPAAPTRCPLVYTGRPAATTGDRDTLTVSSHVVVQGHAHEHGRGQEPPDPVQQPTGTARGQRLTDADGVVPIQGQVEIRGRAVTVTKADHGDATGQGQPGQVAAVFDHDRQEQR